MKLRSGKVVNPELHPRIDRNVDIYSKLSPFEKELLDKFIPFTYSHGSYFVPNEKLDPINIAFMWEHNTWTKNVSIQNFQTEICTTYHEYAYYGFFKPSLFEVLRSLNKELLDKIIAAKTVYVNTDYSCMDNVNNRHIGYTTLLLV